MSKVNSITVWERNAEYIVLGVVGLVVLVLIGWQVIGTSNSVTVANHGEVGPGEVDNLLRSEAQRLQTRLDPAADPAREIPPPDAILERFAARLEQGVSPDQPLRVAQMFVAPETVERVRPDARFVEPVVPAPARIVSNQYFDGLTEDVVQQHESLQERFPSTPYDINWMTIAAVFPEDELIEQFLAGSEDDADDLVAMPKSWHQERVIHVDVVVEREELVNGEWTNTKQLEPIPGQFSIREQLADGGIQASDRDLLLRDLREASFQQQIIRPEFLPTQNHSWIPPNPMTDSDADSSTEEGLFQQLEGRLRAELRRKRVIEERLEDLGTPGTRPPGGDGGGAAGGGGRGAGAGGGGRGAGGGGGGRGVGVGTGGPTDRDQKERLKQDLERINRSIEQLQEQLEELRPGYDPEAYTGDDITEQIVWAHDLSIEPGRVYRYRMAVEVYNPFFLRRIHLTDEQEHLAENFSMRSEFTEWSSPVESQRPVHVFVNRATAPSQERDGMLGSRIGSATIEVFRFYDGRWWEQSFTVQPGQRIGSVREERRGDDRREIDYSTDWFVLDILPDVEGTGASEGRAAMVILQSLRTGEVREMRHPLNDINHPLRRQLRSEVQIAMRP